MKTIRTPEPTLVEMAAIQPWIMGGSDSSPDPVGDYIDELFRLDSMHTVLAEQMLSSSKPRKVMQGVWHRTVSKAIFEELDRIGMFKRAITLGVLTDKPL